MILILPVAFFLLYSLFNKKYEPRIAFINSYLILCFQIFFITELLSFFYQLNSNTVFFFHLFFSILYFSLSPNINFPKINFVSLKTIDKSILIAITFISIMTLIVGTTSPPNNWDSMSYHLSRIQYWIQGSGIHFFDTNNFRQNLFSPLSEFIILHTQILSDTDLFANLVQWVCYIINMVTVSLICKEFGLNRTLQLLSAFFISSMPIVILEASSTQNDLVLSTFILLFYYYQLCGIYSHSKLNLLLSGLALGLGVLTKGTSYVFLFSIGITYLLYQIFYTNSFSKKTIISRSIIIFSISLLINLPHYTRTYYKYGDFLGLDINQIHANETFSFFTIFSNLIRHLAFQLGSNIDLLNWYLYRLVQVFLGNKLSDPKTSFMDSDFRPPFFSLHEDAAGNFIHTIVITLLFVGGILFFKKFKKIQMTSFWISLISIFLYCLLFKWQPYTAKILSLLIITTPFVFMVINQLLKKKYLRNIIYSVFFLMFIGAFPYIFYNKSRPFLPMNSQSILYQDRVVGYFNNRPELFKEYQKLIDGIVINNKSAKNSVAYHLGGDAWDYPFWIMLKEKFDKRIPYIFHLKKDKIFDLAKSNSLPNYIILENRFLDNLSGIRPYFEIVESQNNFSLMKKI
ncbi:MAG: hypothetical protein CMF94_01605 [Candidatus Marinimicrobia bacterium]|nr:hypothetical protein [Candidatus Neomarinimicrobiota bacterium]